MSTKKCFPPSTSIEWLGYQIDTVNMTIAIPPMKMEEIHKECDLWYVGRKVNKTMVQSIVGKFIFIANCVTHARKFVARMLNTLRGMHNKSWVTVNHDFMKDIDWFKSFAALHGKYVCSCSPFLVLTLC